MSIGDRLIEKHGQLFAWDPAIDLDRIAESIVDAMLAEIAELAIAADYRISAISRGENGHLMIDHNIYSLPETPQRDALMAIIAHADDRVAKLSLRQKETRDRIAELRQQYRDAVIEAARAQPITEKIGCDAGWIPLIVDFVSAADEHPDFVLISASEKWGILDLDYAVDPSAGEAVRALAQTTIDESSRTCETCGADGTMRLKGWRKTLCDRHALERRLQLTEAEHEALMTEFSASQERWRPILQRHRDDNVGSDALFESFMLEFKDLDMKNRRFWAMNLTRIVLAGRDNTAGGDQ
jgi:hypothetical protein